jgi:predicted small lipoprotein YifL
MKLVYLLLLSSLLAGCGLKGPLIVPKNPQHLGLFDILSP